MAEEDVDARLRTLLGKRGPDLVKSLVEELGNLNRELAGLKRELAALTDYQAARDHWLALEDASLRVARLPKLVVIEPDQAMRVQDGFYPIEYTASGTPFRWTGPSVKFCFDIYIDRAHGADIRLDVLNCIDFEVQKNLTLLADAETIPLDVVPDESGFVATAYLPPRSGGRGTSLAFILPATLQPPESSDTRKLGVAFGRFAAASRSAESEAEGAIASAPEMSRLDGSPEELGFGDPRGVREAVIP